ncbi:MAG: hypothetical protein COY82_01625 [Parcubacteria group bacterium CG_4_10_14_0_8_um_filter_35_7]|nr:MAG: hypothetical protein COX43_00860 [Parcubacteria group bacterium CG23_combo_of_CG06-09_8_20_14_all_35_9]PIY78600.1 MAG: hypothetical protein COY82_01625 [Parcubacteria group bacterium CG_4_10_14_0_8_um_filter_35_7]
MTNESQLKYALRILISDIFKISLGTFIVYFLLEQMKGGFISNYLNLNFLLIFCIISGIITAALHKEREQEEKRELKLRDYLVIFFLTIITAIVVFFEIRDLGWISYFISFGAAVIIILISDALLRE